MTAYYNEFDPKAAAWLKQLIKNGDIAPGYVDERSIIEVNADEIRGYTQHHFFAGIGVWSYALRRAGWSDDRPVCTASLPCQPFSAAGKQRGKDDERHLLPHFLDLVRELRPDTIFGEQVASAIRHGWLDDLQTNMEREGYTTGHCVLGAHSVNSAHQRQRLYWVADSSSKGSQGRLPRGADTEREAINGQSGCDRSDSGLADSNGEQREQGLQSLPGDSSKRDRGDSIDSGLGNTKHDGHFTGEEPRSDESAILSGEKGQDSTGKSEGAGTPGALSSESIEWLYCQDNKYRPIKSGLKPLVDGLTRGVVFSSDSVITPNDSAEARATRLKGYGNAIQADVAVEFISAFSATLDHKVKK